MTQDGIKNILFFKKYQEKMLMEENTRCSPYN